MNLFEPWIIYSQSELSQLDLNGINELKIYIAFNNCLSGTQLFIRGSKKIKHLPQLRQVSRLTVYDNKIRKIDYNKLTYLRICDTRVKSIKK